MFTFGVSIYWKFKTPLENCSHAHCSSSFAASKRIREEGCLSLHSFGTRHLSLDRQTFFRKWEQNCATFFNIINSSKGFLSSIAEARSLMNELQQIQQFARPSLPGQHCTVMQHMMCTLILKHIFHAFVVSYKLLPSPTCLFLPPSWPEAQICKLIIKLQRATRDVHSSCERHSLVGG